MHYSNSTIGLIIIFSYLLGYGMCWLSDWIENGQNESRHKDAD